MQQPKSRGSEILAITAGAIVAGLVENHFVEMMWWQTVLTRTTVILLKLAFASRYGVLRDARLGRDDKTSIEVKVAWPKQSWWGRAGRQLSVDAGMWALFSAATNVAAYVVLTIVLAIARLPLLELWPVVDAIVSISLMALLFGPIMGLIIDALTMLDQRLKISKRLRPIWRRVTRARIAVTRRLSISHRRRGWGRTVRRFFYLLVR